MKHLLLIALIISLISCYKNQPTIIIKDGIFIENVTIISANDEGEIETFTGHLLTDQNQIIYSGKNRPNPEGNYRSIDGSGKFVIPGLIDSHVHLNNIAGLNFRQRNSKKELVDSYFKRLPRNFLYYGYTTLIDVDNYAPELIDHLRADSIGPAIYSCGQKIQVMNDFEMVINEIPPAQRMQMPFLHDKYNDQVQLPDSIDLGKHDAETLVSSIAAKGNICVKTLYEDASSGLPLLWETPSPEILNELVEEAHKNDMKVVLHAPSFTGHQMAYSTDVDVIAHAMWNWTSDPALYLNTELPETHKQLLIDIAKKGIGYQPTFRTILGEIDILDGQFLHEHDLKELYTEDYLDFLKSDDAQWSKKRILNRTKFLSKINPDFYYPIRNKFSSDQDFFDGLYDSFWLKMEQVIQVLVENNANLLFSTDHGAMNMYTLPPGLNGYLEMKHWTSAGVPLDRIFMAATYNNAKAFDLLDQTGTLKTGKTANVLLLNSNPLESLDAYNDISLIINKGVSLNREELGVH